MQQIEQGIYFEDSYLGVTVGHGLYPWCDRYRRTLRAEDARSGVLL
jgi:hypothetical protein